MARGGFAPGTTDQQGSATAIVDLGEPVEVSIAEVREEIERGQRITSFIVQTMDEGEPRVLARGTTVGYRRLTRFQPIRVRRLSASIKGPIAMPPAASVQLYRGR